ncbi:hypothetical protein L4X63_04645 [Geomonas sp. Red32]|uniref:hypothetical protein n=1 Tax=Geomonas sp. Red32 TaxID=2912856 RepID=UPI00202CB6BE|nr:hypothetical protein [Geomonas sp. Red32]MCM0080875.1 hypothetical protein [Geomonas sp. Red32]
MARWISSGRSPSSRGAVVLAALLEKICGEEAAVRGIFDNLRAARREVMVMHLMKTRTYGE